MEPEVKCIIIRSCDACGLSTYSPGDGIWICGHNDVYTTGIFLRVSRFDGQVFKQGVSKNCPLRKHHVLYQLAEDVEFI